MKGRYALFLVVLLLFLAGCNVIPPNAPFEQVADPVFNPVPATYDTDSLEVQISTTDSDASIFYTVDGSIPQELESWIQSLEELNQEVVSDPACGQIFYALNETIAEDLNVWGDQLELGVQQGIITQNDIDNCDAFYQQIPQGTSIELGVLLQTLDPSTINSCNKIFIYLDSLVSNDYENWQVIMNEQVDPSVVQQCSELYTEIDNAFAGALNTLLYVQPIIITESTTIRTIAYQEGKWPSDVVSATYELNPSSNNPPSVDAGNDFTVDVNTQYFLDGTVSDDGSVTIQWSKNYGPGNVIFSSPNAEDTNVQFDATGEYRLDLSADDGEYVVTDYVIATVTDPNQPPTVTLTSPSDGSSYQHGDTISLSVTANDPDGSISSVEFWDGSNIIQTVYNSVTNSYNYQWTTATVGTHSITAKAYDDRGASTTTSPPVTIGVTAVVPTNMPPAVAITSPSNGATLQEGDITIQVDASDSDGDVESVEAFRDGVSVGMDDTEPYEVVWTGVSQGSYTLTAVATDNEGETNTSVPVGITVESQSGNIAPEVEIISPIDGAVFAQGDQIGITANATDEDGTVELVEFLLNSNVIGNDTTNDTTLWSYNWIASNPGNHLLTAKAYDNQNANGVSLAVNITVNPGPYCGDGLCNGFENNNVCPADCTSNGGGSSGGGGGGGGGGGSTTTGDDENTTTNDDRRVVIIRKSAGEQTTPVQTGGTTVGATTEQGDTEIGDVETETKGLGIWLWIIIVILAIGAIVAFFIIRKNQGESVQNPGIPEQSLQQCGEYIRKMKVMGKSKDQIYKKMKSSGWNDEQLKYIFSKYN